MALKEKTTVTQRNLSDKIAKDFRDQIFDPLSNLIDLQIKKQVREPLIKAMINYISLNEEEIKLFDDMLEESEREIKQLQENLKKEKGAAATAKKLKAVELEYLRKKFGILSKDKKTITFKNDKGAEITLAQLKKLTSIAQGLEPGNFDRINIIGRVIGKPYAEWEKGHESASIISLKVAGILRSPNLTEIQRDYLEKLLEISRRIDHVDSSVLEPFVKRSKTNGYEIIGAILNSDLSGLDIEANVSKQIVEDLANGRVSTKLTTVFEAKKLNNLKSIAQAVVGGMLSEILSTDPISSEATKLLSNIDASNIKGSPTTVQVVENIILGIITNKYRKLKKPKGHKLGIINKDRLKKPAIKKSKIRKFEPKRLLNKLLNTISYDSAGDINLLSTQNLINNILAINVQEQMGDSTDPPGKLRYQSGRFAESAKLLTLTRSQAGILQGTYTYQRNPYDVFLPGHKMGTPKRDPRIYVEGAIREAAITVLKNRFPGIQLGLQ